MELRRADRDSRGKPLSCPETKNMRNRLKLRQGAGMLALEMVASGRSS
jgi:hypothetical protein